ncbi:MAG: hypothetical protein U9O98_00685 [Asgard group archaeon]|nr:hypothetical protein [Asgard group archaeon]
MTMGKQNNTVTNTIETNQKYPLDNAGKFFSFVSSPRIPCVFRICGTLSKPVDEKILTKAANTVLPRFPYYSVILKRKYGWYYWQETKKHIFIENERPYPCQYIPIKEEKRLPFRIIASKKDIIVEFHHSVTDGYGGLNFLRTLIAQYYSLKYEKFPNWSDILHPGYKPKEKEFEYSRKKVFKREIPKPPKIVRAYHLSNEKLPVGEFNTTSLAINVNDILTVSREHDITLTEFLVAIYLSVLQDTQQDLPEKQRRRKQKPIRIMVPINLRNHFPSETMRNFTAYVAPGIDPRLGLYNFPEIISRVHHFKKLRVNRKILLQQISSDVMLEQNFFIKLIPYFVKQLIAKIAYRTVAENLFSGILTNLGIVSLPPPLSDFVENIQLLSMQHPFFKTGCGILIYGNTLNLNFGQCIKESIIEDTFVAKLREFGLSPVISKNP